MKINIKNSEKIEAVLDETNGKATCHTYTTAKEIRSAVKSAEKSLEFLAKKDWKGATIRLESGGIVPNAYKWQRKTTIVIVERFASGWFMTGCYANQIWGDASEHEIRLDQDAAEKLKNNYLAAMKIKVVTE